MQTKAGAARAKKTILKKYGDDYYKRIGTTNTGKPRGDYLKSGQMAKIIGSKGGKMSKRGPSLWHTLEFSRKTPFNKKEQEAISRLLNGQHRCCGVNATMLAPGKFIFLTTEKRANAIADRLAVLGCIIKLETKKKGQK